MAQRRGAVGTAELMPVCLPNRDTLSGWQHPRKPCPRLSAQNGIRFPDGVPSGNRVPESRPRTGHAFRLNAQRKLHPGIDAQTGPQFPSERQPESASRNRRSKWDALFRRRGLRTISWTVTRPFPARRGTRPACGRRARRCASPYCSGRSSPRAPR